MNWKKCVLLCVWFPLLAIIAGCGSAEIPQDLRDSEIRWEIEYVDLNPGGGERLADEQQTIVPKENCQSPSPYELPLSSTIGNGHTVEVFRSEKYGVQISKSGDVGFGLGVGPIKVGPEMAAQFQSQVQREIQTQTGYGATMNMENLTGAILAVPAGYVLEEAVVQWYSTWKEGTVTVTFYIDGRRISDTFPYRIRVWRDYAILDHGPAVVPCSEYALRAEQRGIAFSVQGQHQSATQALNEGVAYANQYPELLKRILAERAREYLALDDHGNALEDCGRASSCSDLAVLLTDKAGALFKIGDHGAAASILTEALEFAQPDSDLAGQIRKLRAGAYLETGEYSAAMADCRAAKSCGELVHSLQQKADQSVQKGYLSLGAEQYSRALDFAAGDPVVIREILQKRGRVYFEQHEYEAALSDCLATFSCSDLVARLEERADAEEKAGRNDEAVAHYSLELRFAAQDPARITSIRTKRAYAFLRAGEYMPAAIDCIRAYSCSQIADYFEEEGDRQMRAGDFDSAVGSYSASARFDVYRSARAARLLMKRAEAHLRLNDIGAALADCRVFGSCVQLGTAMEREGDRFFEEGQDAAAIRAYTLGIRIAADNHGSSAPTVLKRAWAYWQVNNARAAARDLGQALIMLLGQAGTKVAKQVPVICIGLIGTALVGR